MGHGFQPFDDSRAWNCLTCHYWSAAERAPGFVWCLRHKVVMGVPENGCSGYEREPGSDDIREALRAI